MSKLSDSTGNPDKITRDPSLYGICKFGAYCAFIAGLCYVLVVFCAIKSPASIVTYIASEQYFNDFINYKPYFITLKWLLFFANLALVGVVCTFHSLKRKESTGLMNWASSVGLIGLGIGMYQSIVDMSIIPRLATQYAASNQVIQEVIIALGIANPALFILSMGLPGIWFIVVSLMALSNKTIPKVLVFLGFFWGIGNIITVIAHVLYIIPLIYLVAYGAIIAAPLWSILEGLYLFKIANEHRQK